MPGSGNTLEILQWWLISLTCGAGVSIPTSWGWHSARLLRSLDSDKYPAAFFPTNHLLRVKPRAVVNRIDRIFFGQ